MSIKKSIDAEARTVTFDYGNGRTSVLRYDELPEPMKIYAALHGISQKAGDEYSGALKAVNDGDAETVEAFAEECVSHVWTNLLAASWKAARAAGSGGGRTPLIVEALMRLKGMEAAEAAELIGRLTEDQQKNLRKQPAIQSAIAAIKVERLQKQASAGGSTEAVDAILGV